jgi:hypothetical protein
MEAPHLRNRKAHRTETDMQARRQRTTRELFETVTNQGTRWLFVVLTDGGWAITRNGKRVAEGTGDRVSVKAGVETFTTLTHPVAHVGTCNPVVRDLLDRIDAATRMEIKNRKKSANESNYGNQRR